MISLEFGSPRNARVYESSILFTAHNLSTRLRYPQPIFMDLIEYREKDGILWLASALRLSCKRFSVARLLDDLELARIQHSDFGSCISETWIADLCLMPTKYLHLLKTCMYNDFGQTFGQTPVCCSSELRIPCHPVSLPCTMLSLLQLAQHPLETLTARGVSPPILLPLGLSNFHRAKQPSSLCRRCHFSCVTCFIFLQFLPSRHPPSI